MKDSFGDGGLSIGNTPSDMMKHGGSRTRKRTALLSKMLGKGGLKKAKDGLDMVEMMTYGGEDRYKMGGSKHKMKSKMKSKKKKRMYK